ncbi:hypothetical protein [Streptomyces pinistramenti]|uniref:hypothetical protein n=1 Tax=Streptomyces pinistramenti TaxID=2884812 RepID=UPI001D083F90|nr:hypothetical protein [Streptomyces pinistramenti]MCB5907413.1 hypothetical protein [Streptomyces pinistramenti]
MDLRRDRAVEAACHDLAKDAEAGAGARPYPFADGRRWWSLVLDGTRRGSAVCLAPATNGAGGGLLEVNRHLASAQSAVQQRNKVMKTFEAEHAPMKQPRPGGHDRPGIAPMKP